MKLSVIVPSYNESEKLKVEAILEIDNYLKKQNYSYEVLIVDDESTNNTLGVVEREIKHRNNFKLIKNKHGGKAITVMTGLLESKGEIALFTDMDQATPIDQIERLLPKFAEGFDIVIGSRHGRLGAPFLRKLAGLGFSILRTLILGLPFRDTQCGFKAFNRSSIELILPDLLKRWRKNTKNEPAVNAGFDVEILFIAKKKNLKIAEVPVTWRHVENLKQVQLLKDSSEALRDMLGIRINDLKGDYNQK